MTTIDDLLYPDAREPQRQTGATEEGVIISVTPAGARFTLNGFPSTVGFGPAPYVGTPHAGDACLVAFPRNASHPHWVIASWPT